MDAKLEPLLARLVEVLKALADPTRLRILGAVAERPRSGKELAELLHLGPPTISHHIEKLSRAGLVAVMREGQRRTYALDEAALDAFTRAIAAAQTVTPPAAPSPGDTGDDAESRERAKVLKDFFDGPRLRQIPAQRKKRVFVLQHLLERFEPGRDYPERDVNAILREAHDDVATLRRELVDYGFVTRPGGVYRVARSLPPRSSHVAQEITGDEHAWLRRLLATATTGSARS